MEIVKQMKVPAEFLYETIIKSVLADIEAQTDKKLTIKQLKGFEYTKTFSKHSHATIKIEEAMENESYQYRTTNNKNDFLVSYQIRSIDSENCELHYHEKMESFGFMQSMNDTLIGIVWSPMKKKRFKQMLQLIEEDYAKKIAG
ncbi:DUF3284 domain-containing protein [Paraliobacillus salinarum]|uniref:DUF3284 domain-containing protein n=1 Tax=Paraliobacillus salinarum TaxID=1158996 RepID=UPI0015F573AD|nr:DUF3284 domain-containing protein [Paraliobacillus salinarum]